MPCGKKKNCATCHNFKPSLTITMDDVNQSFKKQLCPKIFTMPCVRF